MVASKDTCPSCRTALHNFFVVIWGVARCSRKSTQPESSYKTPRARYLDTTTQRMIPLQFNAKHRHKNIANRAKEPPAIRIIRGYNGANKTRKKQQQYSEND